jgi:hypothetical protein
MTGFINIENMWKVLVDLRDSLVAINPDLVRVAEYEHPAKQIVYDIMADVAKEDAYSGLPVDQLNELVVRAATEYYVRLSLPVNAQVDEVGSDTLGSDSRILAAFPESGAIDANRPATKRCISADGHDRSIERYPMRYEFAVDLIEPFKSITKASVDTVVLPVKDTAVNAPFLLLAIDELPGLYTNNASDHLRRSFTKLVPSNVYSSSRGRSYVVLTPCGDDSRAFEQPIASLSRISLKLMRPNGVIMAEVQDTLRVSKVSLSSDGNWIITTSSFWPQNEFEVGDIVSVTGVRTGIHAFDEFLNRRSGHEVLDRGLSVAPKDGCSSIVIRYAGALNRSNGIYEKDPMVASAFDESHISSQGPGEIDVDGHIMNLSVQMSVTMTIECQSSA